MSFLTAKWENLVIANYKIDPSILKPFIPKGTELDLYQGICYVSLVGFLFKDTKLKGFSIPFHTNFEEVNLRFYVKRKVNNQWRRGVAFIKELVPKPALTFIANTIYKEHYATVPMTHNITLENQYNTYTYSWKLNNSWQSINIKTSNLPTEILPNTKAFFITEHYYGYTKYKNLTFEYEVKHPTWQQLHVIDYNINVDFESVYGNDFKVLNNYEPKSILFAIGSPISVENKKQLT